MKNSAGILIENDRNEILLGHATGTKHWDIPKGKYEERDSVIINTALRETQEETGLVFSKYQLILLASGYFNSEKKMTLYKLNFKIPYGAVNLDRLRCSSKVKITKYKQFPEIDNYRWFPKKDVLHYVSKSMYKFLTTNEVL
jgi:8-oxo-dGTP pyrophosphatase MutT (NUDIX family)